MVMAAAVADFRPAAVAATKIKKGSAARAERRAAGPQPRRARRAGHQRAPGQLVVGFAAETGDDDGDVLTHARAKLARKGCDLLVVNDVSGGQVFGHADNAVVVLAADGSATEVPRGGKDAVAAGIWATVAAQVSRSSDG